MLTDCLAARTIPDHNPKLVFAVNGHAIALTARDAAFAKIFTRADLIHADGQAAVFASRLLTGTPIPERSATTDFIHDASRLAATHGLRFFLLGATEETNARAAEILRETYPGLQIVGRRHGYFGADEEDDICDEINLTKPDVIWVGLSVPVEYEFAVRNKDRLNAGWLVTCGGCYNFITGTYTRAPRWMQAAGLEWLHRLIREPKRLFWRYAVTNPIAIFLLLTRTNALAAEQFASVPKKKVRVAA
jgi:N-acetylglucosaminyldiphosphoundecaprenol N-acetyl-beta-D-mannosaminyltransferase